ncbi:IS66 family insertion sequence element accessory protein TnpB [Escherichia coli]|nr:IS66 family insertion sequence element accessory protein TnpB [Escherichia coli]
MISLPSGTRIWLVAGVTDMRKSFNGLGEQVQHVLDENPFSGHLFIFRGRRGDTIKILWADADGLCLFTKRLEEGQFIWPAVREGAKFWLNVLTERKRLARTVLIFIEWSEQPSRATDRVPGLPASPGYAQ